MLKENALDLMLISLFLVPLVAGILCMVFKRWKSRIFHYTALSLAVTLVVMYFLGNS